MADKRFDNQANGGRSVSAQNLNASVFTGDIGHLHLPPNQSRNLPRTFFHKCDRTDQMNDFKRGLEQHLSRKSKNSPFIVLVYGDEDEEHNMVVDRLHKERLPQLLNSEHSFKVVEWTEPPRPNENPDKYWEDFPVKDFVGRLEDGEKNTSRDKVLKLIRQHPGHLLVKISYHESHFTTLGGESLGRLFDPRHYLGGEQRMERLIKDWLGKLINFWKDWPEIGNGQMAICLVSLIRNSRRLWKIQNTDWLKKWGDDQQNRADHYSPSLLVLTKLQPIIMGDALNWCDTVEDDELKDQIKDVVNEIYKDNKGRPLPMGQLRNLVNKAR